MSIDEKHLNISIYNDNKDKIEKSQNPSESYLILCNEELNNKLRNAINDISEMNAEKSELESDNERMEKSITYQRGLLHNFNGLNKLYEKKSKLQSNIILNKAEYIINSVQDNTKYRKTMFYNYIITLLFNIFIIFLLENIYIQFIMINLVSFTSYNYLPTIFNCSNDDYINISNKFKNKEKEFQPKVKTVQEEIDMIKNKSDFISDLIDES